MPDLEAVRERILSGLKVGKQSPEYKRTKAAIDRFISLSAITVTHRTATFTPAYR